MAGFGTWRVTSTLLFDPFEKLLDTTLTHETLMDKLRKALGNTADDMAMKDDWRYCFFKHF